MSDLRLVIPDSLSRITNYSFDVVSQVTKLKILKQEIEWELYLDPVRRQYNALQFLNNTKAHHNSHSVYLTDRDLFIPIFTHVFGLAEFGGCSAVISLLRLDPAFYGLPFNENLLQQRLQKEVLHEYGHLLGLRHCIQYDCVMASSTTADALDIKGMRFCEICSRKLPV